MTNYEIRRKIIWYVDRHVTNVIYGINFLKNDTCVGLYIGKTNQPLYQRINQHIADCGTVHDYFHDMDYDDICITAKEFPEDMLFEAEALALQYNWDNNRPLINKIIPGRGISKNNFVNLGRDV